MRPADPTIRLIIAAPLVAWAVQASALGLGEIRTASPLGQVLRAEIEVQAGPREIADSACFRLRVGADDSLPWLRQGTLVFRKGSPGILEIRSAGPLRDPILRLGVYVGCGHDLQRDYTLLLTPPAGRDGQVAAPEPVVRSAAAEAVVAAPLAAPPRPRRARPDPDLPAPERLVPVKPARRATPPGRDRLVLSGVGDGGEPSLRLATDLFAWKDNDSAAREAQREILRLEFRTLTALNEQATSQLAAAEKLRNLESTLGELQERAGELTQRLEDRAKVPPPAGPAAPVPASPAGQSAGPQSVEPAGGAIRPPVAVRPAASDGGLSEWTFYGLLLGALAGIAGWLGWRRWNERRSQPAVEPDVAPEILVDPRRDDEIDEPGGVDLPVEPAAMGMPMAVDVPLDADVEANPAAVPPPPSGNLDSSFSIAAATVHEHFEANPVMELAEIMLSFGRVKGAAQALQEFIDQSPNEALKPWIRLLDVYRMAGMREDFERVAQNLNRHFNVEVLQWSPEAAANTIDFDLSPGDGPHDDEPTVKKAMTLEDMPHIAQNLVDSWKKPECSDYLHWLLRDNRGGKRSGFTLPVVNEILFLIELRETLTQINNEETEQKGEQQ